MIALLASPIARWVGVAAFCTVLAGWAWAERAGRHAATQRAEAAEAAVAGRDRAIAALEAEAEAARARAARFGAIRRTVDAAPASAACAASPAVRAALDGLRDLAAGGGGASFHAPVQSGAAGAGGR